MLRATSPAGDRCSAGAVQLAIPMERQRQVFISSHVANFVVFTSAPKTRLYQCIIVYKTYLNIV